MKANTTTCFGLTELSCIGIFPNGYTCDDLVRYVTTLEALVYDGQHVIVTLTKRVRQLENASAPCRQSFLRKSIHLACVFRTGLMLTAGKAC
jgi:hypothetical protein